ncbi:MAG TPA: hypothetical protein DCQ06_04030, partial [Myxococcales bacterium]|nr:hypothetical protein [Myxococcales bacterium]
TNFEDLPACDAVFVGQVADGGDCISNEDCAGGAFCSANEQTCPGKCAARNARGQACTKDSCTKGLYCGEGDTCTDKELDGGACTDDEHCLSGDCEQDSEDSPGNGPDEKGVCVKAGMMPPTIKLGEPCSLEMTSVCEAGAACVMTGLDPSTSEPITLCKAKVAVDETCYLGFPHCPSGYYCDAKPQDGGSFEGACQALPKDGEACLTESFGTCAPGLVCDQGTCRKVARIGEACTSNATCISGLCESGACVVAPCDP